MMHGAWWCLMTPPFRCGSEDSAAQWLMSSPGASLDHTVGQQHSAVPSRQQHAAAWRPLPVVVALHAPVSTSERQPLPVCLVQSLKSPAAVH